MEVWDSVFIENDWGKWPSEALVRLMSSVPTGRVLEVGCGPGANLWYLARSGFDTYGIDGSLVAVEKAKKRMDDEGIRASIKHGDMRALPYPSGCFDVVVDVEGISCNDYENSLVAYSEAKRVLRNGGKLVSIAFSDETEDVKSLSGKGFIRYSGMEEMIELLDGFSIESFESISRTVEGKLIKEWVISAVK